MSRRFGGTGLGLAISWRVVDLMGGCLDVSSRVGEGSTFSFSIELPIDPTASLDVPRRPGNSEAESTTITPASVPLGALLLLVEDNEINRQVVGAMLCGLGVEPGGMASDGFEAVAATDATPFDLILMDCQMPGMDGFEATREIRRKEAGGRHATIVALTANATPEDRERCLAAGMDDFMSKPVRLATLRETLDRWLAPARASTEVWPAAADDIAQPPLGPGPVAPAAQESDGPVVLDQETLAMLRSLGEGGEDVLGPLVDLLESEAEGHLAAIEAAVERGDAQALGGIAHTLKGASRNLGAVLVGEIAAELERRGKSGSAAEAELVSQLKAALVTTSAAFREERQKPGPTTESASQPSPSRDEAA
jgi:CheY-like chemotaxis protein/HPt (histidine-containing phosphotransfer) domain-containing protein